MENKIALEFWDFFNRYRKEMIVNDNPGDGSVVNQWAPELGPELRLFPILRMIAGPEADERTSSMMMEVFIVAYVMGKMAEQEAEMKNKV